jgi:hypothetical protein
MAGKRERRCVCGIPPDKVTLGSQSVVLAHSEGERVCPDCGRERVVMLMHPDFPLD